MPLANEEVVFKGFLTLPELMEYDPEFLTRRREIAPDLEPTFNVEDGTINSRFEDNIYLFEVDDNGNVTFGRLHKREKPNVNVALIDSERALIGINIQMRKAAGGLFAQPVMGFNLNRLMGKNASQVEANQSAAIRESLEENGITDVRDITPLGVVMVNQTSFTSESAIFIIDCDSSTVSDQLDFAEGIRSAIWISPEELLRRINLGTYEGVRYDNGPLLWTMMRLFARYPVIWFQYRKQKADSDREAAFRAQQRGLTMAHIHWCYSCNDSVQLCPEGFCHYKARYYTQPHETDPESGLVKVGDYGCPNCPYD